MDIMERIELMRQYSIIDEQGYRDLVAIVELLKTKFQIMLTEENGGVMITHIAAAFGRIKSGDTINPLSEAALEGLTGDEQYDQAQQILQDMVATIDNELPDNERDFVLLHICTLLYGLNK